MSMHNYICHYPYSTSDKASHRSTHLKSRMRELTMFWKLLCLFIAPSGTLWSAMLPNICKQETHDKNYDIIRLHSWARLKKITEQGLSMKIRRRTVYIDAHGSMHYRQALLWWYQQQVFNLHFQAVWGVENNQRIPKNW